MALGREESEQRRGLQAAWPHADITMEELWLRYFTIGGQAGQFEVEAYIHGAMALPALQRDTLAHALNERLDELGSQASRAPYSQGDDAGDAGHGDGPGIRDPDGGSGDG